MTQTQIDLPELDSCGTGFVCDIQGRRSHEILREALHAVARLEHRGAVHPDGRMSDGAGVLTHIPWTMICDDMGLDDHADLALATLFAPEDDLSLAKHILETSSTEVGLTVVGWRVVPFDANELGASQVGRAPSIHQLVVRRANGEDDLAFERALLVARRKAEKAARSKNLSGFSIPSMSSQTVVYKALVVPSALPALFPDLTDPRYETAVALFHQRYSTNTMPSWHLAQPLRMLAHNGEINTLLGNVNRMKGRQTQICAQGWLAEDGMVPLIAPNGSDSLGLDNTLELLCAAGRNPVHAVAMLVPDAYEGKDLKPSVRDFYRYHATLMEPWDGPAALVFTNGRTVGAALDRNGLRPLRYWITDDRVIVASEAGVVDVVDNEIKVKGRLGPGKMISVNTATGRVFYDEDIKDELVALGPWSTWLENNLNLFDVPETAVAVRDELIETQKAFGWGREHIEKLLEPMAF